MRAIKSVVAHAPYTICIGSRELPFNHFPIHGVRVDRCERTRSMTTFSGHGRRAVRNASSSIARTAQNSFFRKGPSNGNNGADHCLNLICAGGWSAMSGYEVFDQGSSSNPRWFLIFMYAPLAPEIWPNIRRNRSAPFPRNTFGW